MLWGVGGLTIGIIIGLALIYKKEIPLLNPGGIWDRNKIEVKNTEVVGFLPTWMVGKTRLYGKELSQLVFLGIEVREDGSLVWDIQSKKIDNEEYGKMKTNISRYGGKNILGIKLFEDEKLDKLIVNPEARKRLRDEVEVIVNMGGFDGVNIDFEYMSNPLRIMETDFLTFLDEVKQSDWGEVSIDVFANTIIKGNKDSLSKLLERVDWVIVMAYDFHRPGSDKAGPVAPLVAEIGQRSITEVTSKLIEYQLNKNKVILAYPLYGYKWETVNQNWGSATMTDGYGATVLYSETVGFTGVQFDDRSMTPWVAWTEKDKKSKVQSQKVGKKIKKVTTYYYIDQWHQAYFEDEKSLRLKIDLAKQTEVGGVGYWALGYEGKENNLIENLHKSP